MTIASILHGKGTNVVSVSRGHRVDEVVSMLCEHRIGAVLVMEDDRIIGVLSERDIIRGLQERGAAILESGVDDIMTEDVLTVEPDEQVTTAMSMMTRRRIRHLPVVTNGKLTGLVSIGDLVKRRIEEAEREAASLMEYIQQG